MSQYRSNADLEAVTGGTVVTRLAAQAALVQNPDGSRSAIVHDTAVATHDGNGAVSIDSGGWITPTTRKNINRALDIFGRGQWRLYIGEATLYLWHWPSQTSICAYDGMVIDSDLEALTALMSRAESACTFRGHKLAPWSLAWNNQKARTFCTRCKATVAVELRPPANGIDIGGPALALTCDPKGVRS